MPADVGDISIPFGHLKPIHGKLAHLLPQTPPIVKAVLNPGRLVFDQRSAFYRQDFKHRFCPLFTENVEKVTFWE